MATLTQKEIRMLNNLGPEAKSISLGTRIQEALSGDIPTGSIATAEIANNAISLAKISLGLMVGIAVEDAKTTSREENVAGLSSAIALANSLKTKMNGHAADALEHLTAIDNVNFPITAPNATDIASLVILTTAMILAYDGHDNDSELGAAWAFHTKQEDADHSLASTVPPTNLQECITRLNDIQTKFNAHDADGLVTLMALANSLKTVMNAHAADATDHTAAVDNVNFPVATADATNYTTLIALTTALLTAYDNHDADAELAAAWVFHAGQETADHSLTSAAAPTTMGECVTRLNDLKVKFNAHDSDGLVGAMALANSLKTITNAHASDAAEHTTAVDNVNYPIATANATNLATLIALATTLLASYDNHDADAELGAAWAYHDAQESGNHSLVSAAAPTTLQECITRLNDLKAKFNAHDADATPHTTGSLHQEATVDADSMAHGVSVQHQVSTANASMIHGVGRQYQDSTSAAAYGAAISFYVAGVQTGDSIVWGIMNDGTGNVTGVSAVASTNYITMTFSADPQNDAIVNYAVFRTAT